MWRVGWAWDIPREAPKIAGDFLGEGAGLGTEWWESSEPRQELKPKEMRGGREGQGVCEG